MSFVVYQYFYIENGAKICRYVGAGTKRRAHSISKRNKAYTDHAAANGKPLIEIFHKGLTKVEAHAIEIELIAMHGRICDGGTLFNLSTGGASGAGYPRTAEHRAKVAETRRNLTGEQRERVAAAQRGKKHTAERRANISEAITRWHAARRATKA